MKKLLSFMVFSTGLAFISYLNAQERHELIELNSSLKADLLINDLAKAGAEAREFDEKIAPTLTDYSDTTVNSLYANTGEYFFRMGDFPKAENYLVQNLLNVRKYNGEKSSRYLKAMLGIAKLLEVKGVYNTAEIVYQKCLQVAASNYGKTSGQFAAMLSDLGRINAIKGEFEDANIFYENATNTIKSAGLEKSYANARHLINEADFFDTKGKYTAAENLYRQAIYLAQIHGKGETELVGRAYAGLAKLDYHLNNLGKAIDHLDDAQRIIDKVYGPQHPWHAKLKTERAWIHLSANDTSTAENLLAMATSINDSVLHHKHPDYLYTKHVEAELLKKQSNFVKAEKLYNNILDTLTLTMGPMHYSLAEYLNHMGNFYYEKGEYDRAIGLQQRSIEIEKEVLDIYHPKYTESVNELSLNYWALGKQKKTARSFRKSISNNVSQFESHFAFLSEREKGEYYKTIRSFFEKFYNFVLSAKDSDPSLLEEMYNTQIITKALIFNTTKNIRERIVESKDAELLEKYDRWIEIKELLAQTPKFDKEILETEGFGLDSVKSRANYLEKELSLRINLKKKKKSRDEEVTWKTIKSSLRPEEGALEIIRLNEFLPDSGGKFTGEVLYAFMLVTPDTKYPEVVVKRDGRRMESKGVKKYRNSIFYQLKDKKSYKNLWYEVDSMLKKWNVKKAYVSLDGLYNQVNINTLYNTENKKYVLDEIELHLVTNTKDLLELKEFKGKNFNTSDTKASLFGFPNYNEWIYDFQPTEEEKQKAKEKFKEGSSRGGLGGLMRGGSIAPLPGTKVEIEQIHEVLVDHKVNTEVNLGNDAHEEAFKKLAADNRRPDIIHIATHGFFMGENKKKKKSSSSILKNADVANPLTLTGLVFGGAAYAYDRNTLHHELESMREGRTFEDGILSAYEAMNMDLKGVELIVLSACETGLGVIENGEGVYGLQRSLQTSGAHTIVMSLWKVADEPTQKFMVTFYKNLYIKGNKKEAFQAAQIELRKEYPDPYFWGAFIMVGE